MNHDNAFKRASVGAVWIWLTLFALIPSLMVLAASFLQRGETDFFSLPPTLENYGRIFDSLYLDIFKGSLTLALVSALLCLLLGYPFAHILARTRGGARNILLLLTILPFWTSSLIRTYSMMVILRTKGILNSLLLWAGWIDQPLTLLYTETAVVIGLVYTLLPFMILPLYASIEKLDPRLTEAARDLGANRLQAFRKVEIPLTMPGIVAGSMLVFLPALGMFYVSDLLGGAKTLLVGNHIKNQFLNAGDWPFGSALSVALTGIMVVMLLVYYRSIRLVKKRDGR